jgi:hypothetical protein
MYVSTASKKIYTIIPRKIGQCKMNRTLLILAVCAIAVFALSQLAGGDLSPLAAVVDPGLVPDPEAVKRPH